MRKSEFGHEQKCSGRAQVFRFRIPKAAVTLRRSKRGLSAMSGHYRIAERERIRHYLAIAPEEP
jgi:hypothetical protein